MRGFLCTLRLKSWRALLGGWLVAGMCSATSADTVDALNAFTTEWPPYSFNDSGVIRGISTDILLATCAEARISCSVKMVPWARAYNEVSVEANTVLFTTARTPEREKSFRWVGPLLPRVTWVYGKAEDKGRFAVPGDLRNARIAVVRGESSIKDLEALGVPASAFSPDSSNQLVLKQVLLGFADVMVDTEIGMEWNLFEANVPVQRVAKLMKLADKGHYYFALNINTDPGTVQKLQTALDKLHANGTVTRITTQYLKSPPKQKLSDKP